ncbi:MAG: hydrogenase iron-sulfur subunit [Syntrophorhabdaceae bacterium]|nr:hydrogenase iron-sulfur subunit [Syntrophorhabdaceae bacterium]
MRLSYPASVKIIKVPCTGRVDTIHMLEAFQSGADGVCLVGCLDGDCHFIAGNIRAGKRVRYAKALLDEAGIGGERLGMYSLSASDGRKFAQVMREMTEKIRELGSSPIKK